MFEPLICRRIQQKDEDLTVVDSVGKPTGTGTNIEFLGFGVFRGEF